jgi:GNAT superfamily N-acetyltransferase
VSAVSIRRAGPEDADTLLELIRALAEYEHLEPPDEGARARLVEHGFGPRPMFEAFLAEVEGAAVGYVIVFETYSTFLARPSLFLEDLFVRPEARRRGIGSALLRHLAAEAVARGCGRMEWAVLDWNELAQGCIVAPARKCFRTGASVVSPARRWSVWPNSGRW